MSRWDAAARAVPPPLDPRQRQVVEKLAEFRARNGEAFVDVVRSKQSGNPLYAFLDAGREDDPVAKYYLQCVEARGSGPAEATVGPSGRGFAPNPPISTGTNAGVASFVTNDDFPAGLIPSLARAANAAAGGRNEAKKNAAYTPIHPNDIPGARARGKPFRGARETPGREPEARGHASPIDWRGSRGTSRTAARAAERQGRGARGGGRARARAPREELERIRHGDEGREPRRRQGRGLRAGRGTPAAAAAAAAARVPDLG